MATGAALTAAAAIAEGKIDFAISIASVFYLQRGGCLKREMERDVSGQKAVSSIKG